MLRSLYVHVPFCIHKCGYCDFNSFSREMGSPSFDREAARYIKALEVEAKLWDILLKDTRPSIDFDMVEGSTRPTVFFGGGTPTLLGIPALKDMLDRLSPFIASDVSEVTIEANPETIDEDKLSYLQDTPATRLSLGIQSFRSNVLAKLERRHAVDDSLRVLTLLSSQDTLRWSGDFIYGIPELSLQEFQSDLDLYLSFGPTHVSAYQLTLKPGHPLFSKLPEDDVLHEWFVGTRDFLKKRGLHAYETSNFARSTPDQSVHNLNYWRGNFFVGLGAGAASFIPVAPWGRTGKNLTDPKMYMDAVDSGQLPIQWDEPLTERQAIDQSVMMSLRTQEGLDLARLSLRFPLWNSLPFADVFDRWFSKGLASVDGQPARLQLTEKGHLFADQLTTEFLTRL